jgi:hypothetical protein
MKIPREQSEIKIFSSDKLTKLIPKKIEGADENVENVLSITPVATKKEEDVLPWDIAA